MTREAKPPLVVFKRKRQSEQRQTCQNPLCTWAGTLPEVSAGGVPSPRDLTCPKCGQPVLISVTSL